MQHAYLVQKFVSLYSYIQVIIPNCFQKLKRKVFINKQNTVFYISQLTPHQTLFYISYNYFDRAASSVVDLRQPEQPLGMARRTTTEIFVTNVKDSLTRYEPKYAEYRINFARENLRMVKENVYLKAGIVL